jgi:hypothetical protein
MCHDSASNSTLNSCHRSLYLLLRDWCSTTHTQQRDHEGFGCTAGSRLDVLGLLDSVLIATLSRYLRRPGGPTLHLQGVRHDWQTKSGQMQPDQPGYARERALVFVEVFGKPTE